MLGFEMFLPGIEISGGAGKAVGPENGVENVEDTIGGSEEFRRILSEQEFSTVDRDTQTDLDRSSEQDQAIQFTLLPEDVPRLIEPEARNVDQTDRLLLKSAEDANSVEVPTFEKSEKSEIQLRDTKHSLDDPKILTGNATLDEAKAEPPTLDLKADRPINPAKLSYAIRGEQEPGLAAERPVSEYTTAVPIKGQASVQSSLGVSGSDQLQSRLPNPAFASSLDGAEAALPNGRQGSVLPSHTTDTEKTTASATGGSSSAVPINPPLGIGKEVNAQAGPPDDSAVPQSDVIERVVVGAEPAKNTAATEGLTITKIGEPIRPDQTATERPNASHVPEAEVLAKGNSEPNLKDRAGYSVQSAASPSVVVDADKPQVSPQNTIALPPQEPLRNRQGRAELETPRHEVQVSQIASPTKPQAAPVSTVPVEINSKALVDVQPLIESIDSPAESLRQAETTHRAENAAAPARAAELPRPAVAQIVDALRLSPGTVDLSLSPEELGRVTLSMQMQNEVLTVLIHAERSETHELIRRSLDALLQEAQSEGFGSVEFGFGQEGFNQHPSWRAEFIEEASQASDGEAQQIDTSRVSETNRTPASGLDLRL